MKSTPTNKQLRDRHNVQERRALARANLIERRLWLSLPENTRLDELISEFGSHVTSLGGALAHAGLINGLRRVAGKRAGPMASRKTGNAPAPGNASQPKPAAPAPVPDNQQEFLF